ncbi:hypothetical protein GWI33_014655 [Rhynchophorus ferrugineus]|uniref:Uncharacterized protein n=1 Tax=Rhynchophorus ferrugineus TaxID=354439 RepID=A0A834I5P8_RHYFE|nr:hypothetical protein GWI33_014655 [Rhynchophorus ferrugineus]
MPITETCNSVKLSEKFYMIPHVLQTFRKASRRIRVEEKERPRDRAGGESREGGWGTGRRKSDDKIDGSVNGGVSLPRNINLGHGIDVMSCERMGSVADRPPGRLARNTCPI